MALIKFFRGDAGVSLPEHQDGAIFVVARDSSRGDIYVDVENGKRLHITPDSPVIDLTNTDDLSAQSEQGKVYLVKNTDNSIGIKVGNGNAYIAHLPIFSPVSLSEKTF